MMKIIIYMHWSFISVFYVLNQPYINDRYIWRTQEKEKMISLRLVRLQSSMKYFSGVPEKNQAKQVSEAVKVHSNKK